MYLRDHLLSAAWLTEVPLRRVDAVADLAYLYSVLEGRFSYLKAGNVDYRALFEDLCDRLPGEVGRGWFGLELQKLLAVFVDGHAAVNARPEPRGFLPFLTGSVGKSVIAFASDRSAFVDLQRPFLLSMDGLPIREWLMAAGKYVPAGSRQLVLRRSMHWLRAVHMLRADMGLPQSEEIEVVVTGEGEVYPRRLRLPVAESASKFGTWPAIDSGILKGNVGYLRLPQMLPEAAADVLAGLERFRETSGLIVDVRGNSGGSRDALLVLLPALMAADDSPRVVNVAAHRLWEGFPANHLEVRQLYAVSSAEWTAAERTELHRFMSDFTPEWQLPEGEFSGWHAMVVSPADRSGVNYRGRPVVVIMDSGCFSATDVFLSALKGLPNVMLIGEASGGGSARAQVVELPSSGLRVRFASMASFQASGELFDGRGVQPDVTVHPEPEYYLSGGFDTVLARGLSLIKSLL